MVELSEHEFLGCNGRSDVVNSDNVCGREETNDKRVVCDFVELRAAGNFEPGEVEYDTFL